MGRHRSLSLLYLALVLLGLLGGGAAMAACSQYLGFATINEIYHSGNGDNDKRFVEVKLLDGSIDQYSSWSLRVCANGDSDAHCQSFALADSVDATAPWIVTPVDNPAILDLSKQGNMSVLLTDAGGHVIDYVSVRGGRYNEPVDCHPEDYPQDFYPWQADPDNNGPHNVRREPDGTGDWQDDPGNKAKDSEGTTNDGEGLPYVTINDAEVIGGEAASFVLTLSGPASADVTISYSTVDDTATAGDDYQAASGTVTVGAGQTVSSPFTVQTLAASDGGDFYVLLDNTLDDPRNASLSDHYGRGRILDASAALNRFRITPATTSASTCTPLQVTIEALNRGGNVLTSYNGTVRISTSSEHGDWLDNDTVNDPNDSSGPDDGETEYTFHPDDNGSIVLELRNQHADDLEIRVAQQPSGPSSESPNLIRFRDHAFVLADVDPALPGTTDVVAGRDHAYQLTLMRRDGADCGPAVGYDSDQPNIGPLKVWLSRHSTDPGGDAPRVVGVSTSAPLENAAPGADNVELDFQNGVASLQLRSTDVGKYGLEFRDDSSGFAVDENGVPRPISGGAAAALVVRPFGLTIDFDSDPDAANAFAVDADGSLFKRAGEGFITTVTAVGYGSGDPITTDGQPGSGADLADNNALSSFGQEQGGAAETVDIAHSCQLPASCQAGVLSNSTGIGGFAGGASTVTLSWNEVGIVSLTASLSDGSYLGGDDLSGEVKDVGRFAPNAFQLTLRPSGGGSTVAFAAPGASFGYLGQPFGYATAPELEVRAVSMAGTVTRNYEGEFWKLGTAIESAGAGAASTFSYTDNVGITALDSPTAAIAYGDTSDANGQVTLSNIHAGLDFTYARGSSPVPPYDPDVGLMVTLNDGDATGNTTLAHIGFSIDSIDAAAGEDDFNDNNDRLLRWGRLSLTNAYGPETRDLLMPLHAEYYGETGSFVRNTADSATTLDVSLFGLSNQHESGETDGDIDITGEGDTSNLSLGGGQLLSGVLELRFSAPGDGNTGYTDALLNATTRPWLRYDWDGDGVHDDDPGAKATFGIYRGSDNLIYIREVY